MNSRRAGLLRGLLACAVLIALVDMVNVLSALHDAARRGDSLAAWEPITWEASSGIAELIACPIIIVALRLAPVERSRRVAALLIHAAATVAFSAVHVCLMMAIRIAIYARVGYHYHVERGAPLYEYRKDVLAYLVLAAVFYLLAPRRSDHPPALVPELQTAPAIFDIVDGARIIRVRHDEILAVRAAGNYAEFRLSDGRFPLMRITLSDIEERLGSMGFVRTHRSWLINMYRVRELQATGSGGHMIELSGGLRVPLSRRYASALERLGTSGQTFRRARTDCPSGVKHYCSGDGKTWGRYCPSAQQRRPMSAVQGCTIASRKRSPVHLGLWSA